MAAPEKHSAKPVLGAEDLILAKVRGLEGGQGQADAALGTLQAAGLVKPHLANLNALVGISHLRMSTHELTSLLCTSSFTHVPYRTSNTWASPQTSSSPALPWATEMARPLRPRGLCHESPRPRGLAR